MRPSLWSALALVVVVGAVYQTEQTGVDEKVTELCNSMGYVHPPGRKLLSKPTKNVKVVPSLISRQAPAAAANATAGTDTAAAGAVPAKPAGPVTLHVGACPYPPYSYTDKDKGEVDPLAPPGSPWAGFSVEMFETVAKNMSYKIEYTAGTYDQLVTKLTAGEIDTIVSGAFYTKRMRTLFKTWAFSQPFWMAGITIMVPAPAVPNQFGAMMSDAGMWSMVAALVGFLVVSGLIFWVIERHTDHREEKDEDGHTLASEMPYKWGAGLSMGAWWSAATVTTVGYGDSFPRTWKGKFWAVLVMFISLFLIAAFTGAVTSAMTVSAVSGKGNGINGINDIDHRSVGVLAGSFPDHFVTDNKPKANITRFTRMKTAVRALETGKLEAIVGMQDVLSYFNKKHPGKFVMVGYPFHQHSLVWPFTDKSANVNSNFGGNKALATSFSEALLRLQDFSDTDEVIQRFFS